MTHEKNFPFFGLTEKEIAESRASLESILAVIATNNYMVNSAGEAYSWGSHNNGISLIR